MGNFLSFKNSNCKYSGVWQENGEKEIVSYGTVASVEIGFEGSVIYIQAHFGNGVCVYIDNEETKTEEYRDGYVVRTNQGKHILKIQSVPGGRIFLKGFLSESDTVIFRTPDKRYIHFIGDSITHAYPGFTSRCANILNADYSCVATCGMSLIDGWGWYQIPDWLTVRPGMESMYFRLEDVNETQNYTDYRFEYCRQPDAILIFLGTNDYINNEADKKIGNFEKFADNYLNFVKRLRQHYPNSKIVIMGPVSGSEYRSEATRKAAELIEKNLKNIYFMQTEDWEIDICDDKTHPTVKGYEQIAENVANFLESIF